jgi:gliding motility-associated protein GldC
MEEKVVRKSHINIQVGLNEQNIPAKIEWQAEDNPEQKKFQECKGLLLALFDKETKETLKIDLWTTEMQIIEMDRFIYQTLRSLTDTYYKATQNQELAVEMQKFVQYFGERTEIIPPNNGG